MKYVATIFTTLVVLTACQRNVRTADSPTQGSDCTMTPKVASEMILQNQDGSQRPAVFEVAIHSATPVEPVDFLGPLDFSSSAIRYKIAHDFITKFSFGTPGVQEVTAILNNPFTRTDVKCTAKFDVRSLDLHVTPLPTTTLLGQEVPFEMFLLGSEGKVTYHAESSDGAEFKLDSQTGKGVALFQKPGHNLIHFSAEVAIPGAKTRTYHLKDQEELNVELGSPLECAARLSTTKLTADAKMGDRMEAVIFPASDPTLQIEISEFNPGAEAYDLTINQNIVSWRYKTPGEYKLSGICRDLATRRLGKISLPPGRILASKPLAVEVSPSNLNPTPGENVEVVTKAFGGLGRAHIAGISAGDAAGLQIVNSNNPNRWTVRFEPNSRLTLPQQVTVEMRDEKASIGECQPPHCAQVPLRFQVQDPS